LNRRERVARLYGVYRQDEGICERALFVIDADGVIHWSYVSPVGVNPGAEGILSALEEFTKQTGGTMSGLTPKIATDHAERQARSYPRAD